MKALLPLILSLCLITSCKMSYKKTHLAEGAVATSPGIYINTKVCLESAVNTGFLQLDMVTTLNSENLLPRVTPYESTAPWYHYSPNDLALAPNILDPNGDEDYSDGIFVDWVLIEVYQDINGIKTYMDGQSALVKFDGTIYDTSGYQGILFPDLQPGNYYVNVIHRNHLAIGSQDAVYLDKNFDENTYEIDFTDTATDYLGAYKTTTNSYKCLLAGDLNGDLSIDGHGDGVIDESDGNDEFFIWDRIIEVVASPPENIAILGYMNSDLNFDGESQLFLDNNPLTNDPSSDLTLIRNNDGNIGVIHADEN